MTQRLPLCVCLAVALLACAACFSDPAGEVMDGGSIQPTLSSIQEQVFSTTCAVSGCHAPPGPQLDLDLSAGQARAHLVGVASVEQPARSRVTAGEPLDSYLFMKITGDARISGERMPLGGAPLAPEQLQAIRDWIEAGAADD